RLSRAKKGLGVGATLSGAATSGTNFDEPGVGAVGRNLDGQTGRLPSRPKQMDTFSKAQSLNGRQVCGYHIPTADQCDLRHSWNNNLSPSNQNSDGIKKGLAKHGPVLMGRLL